MILKAPPGGATNDWKFVPRIKRSENPPVDSHIEANNSQIKDYLIFNGL